MKKIFFIVRYLEQLLNKYNYYKSKTEILDAIHRAQMALFVEKYNQYASRQKIMDDLGPFKKEQEYSGTSILTKALNGISPKELVLPTDYAHPVTLMTDVAIEDVDLIDDEKLQKRLSSGIVFPSPESPVAVFSKREVDSVTQKAVRVYTSPTGVSALAYARLTYFGTPDRPSYAQRYGSLLRIDIVSGGSGYTSAPAVGITGGNGSGAAAIATLSADGIASVTLTNAGTGYTIPPTVSFTSTNVASVALVRAFVAATGKTPLGRLLLLGGKLYGTTRSGGSLDRGVVFSINLDGTGYTVLKQLDATSGTLPSAGLTLGSDGALYGITRSDGSNANGTIFKLNTDGTGFAVLRNMASADGVNSEAALLQLAGVLYGVCFSGGSNGLGTIFKINQDGTGFSVLRNMTTNASRPHGELVAIGGVLYGTANQGGVNSLGALFKINVDGTGFTILRDLNTTDGTGPNAGLLVGIDGKLYGSSSVGGSAGNGTLFKLNTDGSGYVVLKNFTLIDGSDPFGGLVQAASGVLYGTTIDGGSQNRGTLFSINPDGSSFSVLKSFDPGEAFGGFPHASLTLNAGVLYGTAQSDGANASGTIFKYVFPPAITPATAVAVISEDLVYDDATSVDLAWNEECINEIMNRALSDLGIALKDGLTVSYAQAKTQIPT